MKPDRTVCENEIGGVQCGGALTFNPHIEGETVGNNYLIGWLQCAICDEITISANGRPGSPAGAVWPLSKGGRSLDAEGTRIRAEGGDRIEELMRRISRLPMLEAFARACARGAYGEGSEEAKQTRAAGAALEDDAEHALGIRFDPRPING